MKLSPRVKLILVASVFALPIAASYLAYYTLGGEATANYGELIRPPVKITPQPFARAGAPSWTFAELGGRWVLVMSDSGACPAACVEKLTTLRQVYFALGRNAARVTRVFVVDDVASPDPEALKEFDGTVMALTPTGLRLPPGAANDRAHIYLVDPRGNVMMRWPAPADRKRMLKDLQRLLRASQIG